MNEKKIIHLEKRGSTHSHVTQQQRLGDGAVLRGLPLLGSSGAVDEETGDLDLAGGIEGHEADVGVGEGLGAGGDLLQDLRAVGAAEHGELPHGPVAVVIVVGGDGTHADGVGVGGVGGLGVRELEAGGPAVADHVVDLLGDLRVREGREVGEGLEELVVNRLPDHEGGGGLGVGDSSRLGLNSLVGRCGLESSADRHGGLDHGAGDGSHCRE